MGAFFQKSDRLAGEPLLPRVLVPQLDNQGEEARVHVVQVKPGDSGTIMYIQFDELPAEGLLDHHGRGGCGGEEDGGEVHHGGEVLLLVVSCW